MAYQRPYRLIRPPHSAVRWAAELATHIERAREFEIDVLSVSRGKEESWFPLYDLFEKDLRNGEVRRLTWTYAADDRASFSPDGGTIGFTTRRSGYAEVFLMDADGANLRAATRQPEEELARSILENGATAGKVHFEEVRKKFPEAN